MKKPLLRIVASLLVLLLGISQAQAVDSLGATGEGLYSNASVTGSPVTVSGGTLTWTTKNAAANTVLGNFSNSTAVPTYKAPTNAGDVVGLQSGYSPTGPVLETKSLSELGANANPVKQAWCQKWCAAIARVTAGTGDGNVFIVGDSVAAGQGVSTMANTWPRRLIDFLNSNWVTCREGVIWASANANETRWTYSGGWAQTSVVGGFAASAAASASGNATVDPGAVTSDTIKVVYAKGPGLGSFTVKMDGSTTLGTINSSNGSNAFGVQTYSVSSGVHTITVDTPTTGTVYVAGVWFIDSTSKCIYITNSGISGLRMDQWDASGSWPRHLLIAALQPDLTIVCLGINDAQNSVTEPNFATAVNSSCTAIQSNAPTSDILLVQEHPGASAGGGNALLEDYAHDLAVAATTYHTGYLDLFNRYTDQTTMLTTMGFGNALHPNEIGMAEYAKAIGNCISRN